MSSSGRYFATLQDWKLLPAYKAEPRVDSIVGFALPEILQHELNVEVACVVPELPLRIGSVHPEHEGKSFANKSYKVDFFVVAVSGQKYLIEFKTDSGSRREKQDLYLEAAQSVGVEAVIEGVVKLHAATSPEYKGKYEHLLGKLLEAGLLESHEDGCRACAGGGVPEILYIQPHRKPGDEKRSVLGFEEVARSIEAKFSGDEFMSEAASCFRSWSGD